MTPEDLRRRVDAVIRNNLGIEHELQPGMRLAEDLGADSLDMAEIGMDLEEAFGLQYNAIADSLLITVGDTYVQVEMAVNPA